MDIKKYSLVPVITTAFVIGSFVNSYSQDSRECGHCKAVARFDDNSKKTSKNKTNLDEKSKGVKEISKTIKNKRKESKKQNKKDKRKRKKNYKKLVRKYSSIDSNPNYSPSIDVIVDTKFNPNLDYSLVSKFQNNIQKSQYKSFLSNYTIRNKPNLAYSTRKLV